MNGGWRGVLAASAVAVSLLPSGPVLAGATMKYVVAEAPLPEGTEPMKLAGLIYSTRAWRAEVQSIALDELPKEGAKSVTWILVTSNTQARIQKIDVDLFLLDGAEKRVAEARKPLILLAQSTDAKLKIKMKLPAGAWAKAETVRVEVRFTTH